MEKMKIVINICILHGMHFLSLAFVKSVGEWHHNEEKGELG